MQTDSDFQATALALVMRLSGTEGFHCKTEAQLTLLATISEALQGAYEIGKIEQRTRCVEHGDPASEELAAHYSYGWRDAWKAATHGELAEAAVNEIMTSRYEHLSK